MKIWSYNVSYCCLLIQITPSSNTSSNVKNCQGQLELSHAEEQPADNEYSDITENQYADITASQYDDIPGMVGDSTFSTTSSKCTPLSTADEKRSAYIIQFIANRYSFNAFIHSLGKMVLSNTVHGITYIYQRAIILGISSCHV